MKHWTQRLATALLALTGLAALLPGTSRAAPPSVEAFFQEPVLSAAALSPDGRVLAMRVSAKGGRARLAVLNLETMKPTVVASFDEADVEHFQWVNDQRLVFDIKPKQVAPSLVQFGHGLFAVNADASGFRQLVETTLSFAKNPEGGAPMLPWRTRLLKSVSSRQGDDVFVVMPEEVSKDKIDYFKLRRLNTVTGRAEDVDAPLHAQDWTLDAQGALRSVLTREGERLAVQLRDKSGTWKKIAEFNLISAQWLQPRFVGPDGQLYVEAPHHGTQALFTLDAESGKLSAAPVAASKDFDLHVSFVARQDKLLGFRYNIDAEVTQWLDKDMQALQASIDTLLPSTTNRLSVPLRGKSPFVLVQAWADVQPVLSYLFNTETRKLTRIGTSHPGIDPKLMGQTDFVRYKARDGLEIPAYLTLPAGSSKKNLPLVVLVHGGPWVRGATWQWDPEVQFLASRGYAVLQPEFRGSTGYGGRLFEAGFKQWGQAMQDDVADGARWAIAQGTADPKRICIAGASYGGYATLMGLARDPDLFRCGISWVGVTDISLMYSVSWSDLTNESKTYGMRPLIGDPVADAAMLKAASPLENAARIKQPLLLAYGGWDSRVPLIHGEKFRDAVKPHNSQVEWVVYKEQGHGWDNAETRVDFWNRVEKFLSQHLAPP